MQGCHFGVGALRAHLGGPDLTLEPTSLVLHSKYCNDTVFGKKLLVTLILSCTLFHQLLDFLVWADRGPASACSSILPSTQSQKLCSTRALSMSRCPATSFHLMKSGSPAVIKTG